MESWLKRKVVKEEPTILWENHSIAVISKPPYWVCSTGHGSERNKVLLKVSASDADALVESGKVENLAHFVILKFRDNEAYQLAERADQEFGLAHRLDVDTSGALLMAKAAPALRHLQDLFHSHMVYKEYLCLVHGAVRQEHGKITFPIAYDERENYSYISYTRGQWACSEYTLIGTLRLKKSTGGIFSLCRVVIVTGRTHQIRCHMQAIGHPLVSDRKYSRKTFKYDTVWCKRIFLHAYRLGFWDCERNWQEVNAPVPKDLKAALKVLDGIELDPIKDSPTCRILSGPSLKQVLMAPDTVDTVLADISAVRQPVGPDAVLQRSGPIGAAPAPLALRNAARAPLREVQLADGGADEKPKASTHSVKLPNGIILEVPQFAPPPPPGPSVSTAGMWLDGAEADKRTKSTKAVISHRKKVGPPPPGPAPAPPCAAIDWLGKEPKPAEKDLEQVVLQENASQPSDDGERVGEEMAEKLLEEEEEQFSEEDAEAEQNEEDDEDVDTCAYSQDKAESETTTSRSAWNESDSAERAPKLDLEEFEEVCRQVVARELFYAPGFELSLSELGDRKDVVEVLQHMGRSRKRKKLSQMLQEQPAFVLKGPPADLLVSLSKQARQDMTEDRGPKPEQNGRAHDHGHGGADEAEACNMLVEMGFDRQSAMKVWRKCGNDMEEAIDMLEAMNLNTEGSKQGTAAKEDRVAGGIKSEVASLKPGASKAAQKRANQRAKEKNKKVAKQLRKEDQKRLQREQRTAVGASKGDWGTDGTDDLQAALELSMRETEQEQERLRLDEQTLERALSASLSPHEYATPSRFSVLDGVESADGSESGGDEEEDETDADLRMALALSRQDTHHSSTKGSAGRHVQDTGVRSAEDLFEGDEDEDNELRNALELSRRQEDERKRAEEREQLELDKALQESARIYEQFHLGGHGAITMILQDALQHDEDDDEQDMDLATDEQLQAISNAYDAPLVRAEPSSSAASGSGSSGLPFQPSSGAAASTSSAAIPRPALDAEANAMKSHATAKPSGSNGMCGASGSSSRDDQRSLNAGSGVVEDSFDIQAWFMHRMKQLNVNLDGEMLFGTLNMMEVEQLQSEAELKMYLGFAEDEDLSEGLKTLTREFHEKIILLRLAGCA